MPPQKKPTAVGRMLIADVKELPTPFNQLCKAEKKSQICLQAASQGILQGGEGLCFELI